MLERSAYYFDAQRWHQLNTPTPIFGEWIDAIAEGPDGHIWFGSAWGLSRYDGTDITPYPMRSVNALLADTAGNLWIGFGVANALKSRAQAGGVSRYNGTEFSSFTTADGLAHNVVKSIMEDRRGHLWFGTLGGGVSRYDGLVWQNMTRSDGLVNDLVQQVMQDRNGAIWIATGGGVTRYQPSAVAPGIALTQVIADRNYAPDQHVRISSLQDLVVFEFSGRSLTTGPDNMAYVYRLRGYQDQWLPTHVPRVEYTDLPRGNYTFEVKAVDRDLNYSATPAQVNLSVLLPYAHQFLTRGSPPATRL